MAKIVCWRSGEAKVVASASAPEGTITLMIGPRARLLSVLETQARHAHDGKTLLVPGLPEAESGDAATDAAIAFKKRLEDAARRARQ